MIRDWQTHRIRFNHDWLKNTYLVALGGYLRALTGDVIDPEFEKVFLHRVFPEWQNRRGELTELFNSFESQMSPSELFSSSPLAQCRAQTRAWLEPLVCSMWRSRCHVRQLIVDGFLRLKSVDLLYDRIRRRLRQLERNGTIPRSARSLPADLVDDFRAFHDCCEALSAAISRFPSRIRVS